MIEVNKIYTYPELCKIFGEETKTGKGKQLQVKRWNEEYLIEKSGTKYKIIRELTNRDKQYIKEVNSFSDYLQNWVLSVICDEQELVPEKKEYVFKYKQLIQYSPLVNTWYYRAKENPDSCQMDYQDKEKGSSLSPYEGKMQRQRWFYKVEHMNQELVNYALKKLQSRGLIITTQWFKFYKYHMGENGEKIIYSYIPKVEQVTKFINIRLDAIHSLGYKDLSALYKISYEERQKYEEYVSKRLKEMGYDSYANAVKIIVAQDLYKNVGDYMINIDVNKEQCNRLLNSSQFKQICPIVHKEMVNKLINKEYNTHLIW